MRDLAAFEPLAVENNDIRELLQIAKQLAEENDKYQLEDKAKAVGEMLERIPPHTVILRTKTGFAIRMMNNHISLISLWGKTAFMALTSYFNHITATGE